MSDAPPGDGWQLVDRSTVRDCRYATAAMLEERGFLLPQGFEYLLFLEMASGEHHVLCVENRERLDELLGELVPVPLMLH